MAEGIIVEPTFVAEVSEALRRELPGATIEHQHIRAERYQFVVIWDRFDAMDHPERQHLVWGIAKAALTNKRDLLNVAMIFTLGNEDLPPEVE